MYKALLFLHWKQVRFALVPAVIASFGLPLLLVSGMGSPNGSPTASLQAYQIVSELNDFLYLFPALAAGIGAVLALSAWNWDHQFNHVYALSLPVTRFEYVLNKLLAGFTLALIPAAGLWLGAHVASLSVSLPVGLRTYPNQLAVRYLFALFLMYGLLFAFASGTKATTVKVLSGVVGLVVLGTLGNELLAGFFPYFADTHVLEAVMRTLVEAPGPFQVFTGNWALIDV